MDSKKPVASEVELSAEDRLLIKKAVREQLWKYARWLFVVNALAFVMASVTVYVYVFFLLPTRIATDIANSYDRQVKGIEVLREKLAAAKGEYDTTQEKLTKVKKQVTDTETTVQQTRDRASGITDQINKFATQIQAISKENSKLIILGELLQQLEKSPNATEILKKMVLLKSRLDTFRQEVYGDIARVVVKKDATLDELNGRYRPEADDYERFTRWALDHGHGAGMRSYPSDPPKGKLRGVNVIMPAELREKAERISRGGEKFKFKWD